MPTVPYQDIFIALDKATVRYLVAGGFAVNFHGAQRATMDLDLILHLEKENTAVFDDVMRKLGFVPKVPVNGKDLGDPGKRKQWIEEKNMVVFSYVNPDNPMELVDIFVQEPKPFQKMFDNRFELEALGIRIPVVGLDDLIEMKELAGRDKDKFDIIMLRKKHADKS